MSEEIVLNADNRVRTGTNKNRETRRNESMVPAVIYGNNEDTKNIKLYLNEITKASESELFFTQVLKIMLDGNEEKVVLKELQREPEKGKFLHADFMRVSSKTKLNIPRTAATGTAASTRINKPTIIVSAMTLLLCLSATFADESNVYTLCFFLHGFRNRRDSGNSGNEVPIAL